MSDTDKPTFRVAEPGEFTVAAKSPYSFITAPELDSNWQCYLFGNKPGGGGMVYTPNKGSVPNWFVRWMMKVCLGCVWVRK